VAELAVAFRAITQGERGPEAAFGGTEGVGVAHNLWRALEGYENAKQGIAVSPITTSPIKRCVLRSPRFELERP
jgi:hypothetical protein